MARTMAEQYIRLINYSFKMFAMDTSCGNYSLNFLFMKIYGKYLLPI